LHLPALYLLVFCTSAFSPLFEAAATSSISSLVDPRFLAQATALNASVVQLSNLIGAALGGLFLAIASLESAIAINALSFAASFLLIRKINTNLSPAAAARKEPYCQQLLAGFTYLAKVNRPIGYILALFAASNFFASSILFFVPMVVKTIYHRPVTWVAVLEGSMAGGFVAVSIALSFIPKGGNVYLRSFLGGWVITAAFGALAFGSPLTAAFGLFCLGLSIAWSGASMQILFQRSVDNAMKGRFFSLMSTAVYLGFPLSFLFNGFMSDLFPLKHLLIFNGLAVLVINLGFLIIPRHGLEPKPCA